ncbi:E3 ubiquitin-protein ligase RNF115 isoform X1 [Brachionichthys hirsutus]|uniref:E3 ubiquitin-protein ligase RNF115 isoform X1 n=1 Tax=Brachionichthys hirsutus TaxID=412623 RepID=UPI00360486D7
MAEAAEAQQRFFCRRCESEIYPELPDFVCPGCDSPFIEAVSEDSSPRQDGTSAFGEELLFMEPSSESDGGDVGEGPADWRSPPASPDAAMEGHAAADFALAPLRIVQQFLAGMFASDGSLAPAPAALVLRLHGNPGDYVWGRGGLDAAVAENANWSVPFAGRSTPSGSRSGSCLASTTSTVDASCLGWSCMTPVPCAEKASTAPLLGRSPRRSGLSGQSSRRAGRAETRDEKLYLHLCFQEKTLPPPPCEGPSCFAVSSILSCTLHFADYVEVSFSPHRPKRGGGVT